MGVTSTLHNSVLGKEQGLMLFDFIVLVISGLIALGALGVIVWQGIAGRLFTMDGLDLTLICLALIAAFGGNLGWSIRSGEAMGVLRGLRKKPAEEPPSDQRPSAAA